MRSLCFLLLILVSTLMLVEFASADHSKNNHQDVTEEHDVDVVIVGSGVSGLTTAYQLRQKVPGIKIAIVEALDYAGGRTRSMFVNQTGDWISVGGTFLFSFNTQTLTLAKTLGCSPADDNRPLNAFYISKTLFSFRLLAKLWTYGWLVVRNDPRKYWTYRGWFEDAKSLDRVTLDDWLDSQYAFESERAAVRQYFFAFETMTTQVMSALFASILIYTRWPLFEFHTNFLQNPNPKRWENGTGVLVDCLMKSLGTEDLSYHLSSPVNKIVQDDHGVQVYTTNQKLFRGKYVVMATSPFAAMNVKYIPMIPEAATILGQSCQPSHFSDINIYLIYENHWWKKFCGENCSAYVFDDFFPNKTFNYHDNSFAGLLVDVSSLQNENGHGIVRILSWPAKIQGKSMEKIGREASQYFAQFFKDPEAEKMASNYLHVTLYDWGDYRPYIPGVAFQWSTGALTAWNDEDRDNIRDPFGRIHWGGSERAERGHQWIEGAVDRGVTVAHEVALLLNPKAELTTLDLVPSRATSTTPSKSEADRPL